MFATIDPSLSDEVAALCDQIVPAFTAGLDAEAPQDPAEVEQIVSRLILAIDQIELPPEVPAAVVSGFERQATTSAATMLEVFAALAREPLAAPAVAAVGRLADIGVVSPFAGRLGALTVRGATRCESDDGELLAVQLRRRGSRKTQLALIGIDRGDTGGALASCLLTPPMTAAQVRRIVASFDEDGLATVKPIAPEELVEVVRAGAQRAVDIGLALDADSAAALPLVARALTGDQMGIPRPRATAPWDDDDDDPELIVDAAEDEDHYFALMEQLLDEFEQHARAHHEPPSAIWDSGDFVASCMLEWKGGYGDGLLGRWTGEDIAEFLLDYVPRKVSASTETLEVMPECVLAFLEFLDARGSLSGEPLETLAEACSELSEPFRESIDDPAGWGLAKSMAMAMLGDGIDPNDPADVEAWMADFNARPREERDAIVGPTLDRMFASAPGPRADAGSRGSGSGSASPRRAKQRKAQRSARKKNRPRR